MAHAQKPDFVFRRNGRVHLNRRGASVQSTTGSRGVRISGSYAGYTTFRWSVWVLATHSIRQFPLHFPSRASPCAIRFQTHYTTDRHNEVPEVTKWIHVLKIIKLQYLIYFTHNHKQCNSVQKPEDFFGYRKGQWPQRETSCYTTQAECWGRLWSTPSLRSLVVLLWQN